MSPRVAALLFILTVCLACKQASSEVPIDCCLVTTDKRFPRSFKITSHFLQTADMGCDIAAAVFITKSGARLCTPHPTESKWVADYIKRLEQRGQ
ncbi:hypothetical protein UPYG_G00190700 [Umbra pygmaea]|uniref:Chemokine interleukin-8-like domain-containing protein n=1 Tax=Umbra pygmaea TaxID=75934 RepID=A0ABD0WSR2_UMBPY